MGCACPGADARDDAGHERRSDQVGGNRRDQCGIHDRECDEDPRVEHRVGADGADRQRPRRRRLGAAQAGEREGDVRGRRQSSKCAANDISAPWPDDAAEQLTEEAQAREEEDEEPELSRPDAAPRTVRAGRQQRQHHDGHHGEANRRAQFEIVNPAHERVQPGLLEQHEDLDRDDRAREAQHAKTGQQRRRRERPERRPRSFRRCRGGSPRRRQRR